MIEVRLASKKDANSILKLLHQVEDVHADIRPDIFKHGGTKFNEEEVLKLLNEENVITYVATLNDVVVGYAILEIREVRENSIRKYCKTLFVEDICVDENHRREGIGRKLFEQVEKTAKEGCFDNLMLNVWNGNDSAMKFYEALGFKVRSLFLEKNC